MRDARVVNTPTRRRPRAVHAPLDLSVLEAAQWPFVVLDSAQRVRFANSFAKLPPAVGPVLGQLVGAALSPPERREIRAHARRWAAGDLHLARLTWPRAGGVLDLLVVPVPLAKVPDAWLLLAFLPVAQLEAAIAGEAEAARSRASGWLRPPAEAAARLASPLLSRSDPGVRRLSAREWQVAQRIALGERTRNVAEALGLAQNTVRNHLKTIFRKLEVSSQAQLARKLRVRWD